MLSELCSILNELTIPIEEIIAGGGGESKGTQRLRRALAVHGWEVVEFKIQKIINGVERESISHKMAWVGTSCQRTSYPESYPGTSALSQGAMVHREQCIFLKRLNFQVALMNDGAPWTYGDGCPGRESYATTDTTNRCLSLVWWRELGLGWRRSATPLL